MPSSFMKIGQLCAAKFAEDSNWHRGTIMGFKDSLVQVVLNSSDIWIFLLSLVMENLCNLTGLCVS